jgi:hypothetical protein
MGNLSGWWCPISSHPLGEVRFKGRAARCGPCFFHTGLIQSYVILPILALFKLRNYLRNLQIGYRKSLIIRFICSVSLQSFYRELLFS